MSPGADARASCEIRVEDGPLLVGPRCALAEGLDASFASLAATLGAEPWSLPPVVSVRDLRRIDYFSSFPHIVMVPAAPRATRAGLEAFRRDNGHGVEGPLALGAIEPVDVVLAPAACYTLYPALRGRDFGDAPYAATLVGTCFRREADYKPLERQAAFRMREIVHVGTIASARAFLDALRSEVETLARGWAIALDFETATDPFFDPERSPKYVHQKLFPSKHEMVSHGLALGSLNLHRSFFGEAFDLRVGGSPAHTACVAFGIERWVGAVLRVHGDDPASWPTGLVASGSR